MERRCGGWNTGYGALSQACFIYFQIDLPMAPVSHPEENVSLIYFYKGAIPMREVFYIGYNYFGLNPYFMKEFPESTQIS